MSAPKEGNVGEILLYRERPSCYIVKVLSTPDTEEMWHYDLEILYVLDGYPSDEIGDKYSVSKSKEYGQMAGWSLWCLEDEYSKGWTKTIPEETKTTWKK